MKKAKQYIVAQSQVQKMSTGCHYERVVVGFLIEINYKTRKNIMKGNKTSKISKFS